MRSKLSTERLAANFNMDSVVGMRVGLQVHTPITAFLHYLLCKNVGVCDYLLMRVCPNLYS